jgi:hypothetical protein
MKFAAVIDYTPDKAKIQEVRPAHREYLAGVLKDGKLVVGGPFLDDSGAIIIYETDSAEAAELLVRNHNCRGSALSDFYGLHDQT